MVGLIKLLATTTTLVILSACVPEQKKTTCGTGQAVNATLRTCVPISALNSNNRPVGIDQTEHTAEDSALNFTVNSGTDADGDSLNYIIVTSPANGTLTNCMNKGGSTGLTDRTCTYTPNSNYNGTDTFTYKINDGLQDSDLNMTVSVVVSAVNDAPTIILQSPVILEDTPTTYTFSYTDPENDKATSCTAVGSGNMTTGACTCDAVGVCRVTVTPDANENSSYLAPHLFSINLTLTAGALSGSSVEYFTVTPVNDRPVITPAVFSATTLAQGADITTIITTQPSSVDVDTIGDLPLQTRTWALTSANTCSWVTINASTGALSGAPGDANVGTCNLIYNVTDNLGYNDNVTVTTVALTITNVAPVLTFANALTIPVEDTGTQLVGTVSSATACGTANYCLTVDKLSNGTLSVDTAASTCDDNGTITLSSTSNVDIKNIYYTPNANYASQVATCNLVLKFQDQNGTGLSSSATGTFTVQEVNDAPTFSATISAQTINETTPFALTGIKIDKGGGSDENGQTLTVLVSSSNTTLVPHAVANLKLYSDSTYTTPYVGCAIAGGLSCSAPTGILDDFYLLITPAAGQTGTSTITITLTDNGTTNAVVDPKTKTISFVLTVTNKAAVHNGWTEIYATGAKVLYDGTVSSVPNVRFKWGAFTPFNTSITGYKVYRSTSSTGPFVTPVTGCTNVTTTSRTCTDSTLGSLTVSSTDAGSVYYYRVKAIASDGSIIDTNSTYSTLKIPVPYNNMALVPRQMANLEACSLLGGTTDKLNSNRCTYTGYGDTASGGITYYDLGNDYFIDRYEASCNYTNISGDCDETAGVGCIGNGTPGAVGVTLTSTEAIYYDRANGECYFHPTAGAWTKIANLTAAQVALFNVLNQKTSAALATNSTFPKRPPIVKIQQQKAHLYCSTGSNANLHSATVDKSLVNRKVHIAASAWSSTTTSQGTLEEGAAISLTNSYCNSSYGGNLNFQDGLISALIDTWTATETSSSTFSFVMAGSDVTSSCQSRYGIQDLVGNVEEWNLDRFYNRETYQKDPILNSGAFAQYLIDATYDPFFFGTLHSVLARFNAGAGNSLASAEFKLRDGFFDLSSFFLPLGIPVPSATPDAQVLSSTIFNDNNDKVYIDSDAGAIVTNDTTVEDGELNGLTSGGNFEDQTGAGRYSMRFRSVCHDNNADGDCGDGAPEILANGTEENIYTGFRCMIVAP